MASKISIYGLSGSGKSCYIYAMTQAMRRGFRFDNGRVLTVASSNLQQTNLLNQRFTMMTNGVWPPGTAETTEFTYMSRMAFSAIAPISIRDYRGGIFSSIADEDMAEVDALYSSFKDSGALAFFVGTDKVMRAMQGDVEAYNDLGLMQTLYEKYLDIYPNDKTPIIFVLTKSDLATPDQLEACKDFVRDQYAAFFGTGTGLTVGLTAVTLGRNLSCGADNELIGELRIGPSEGNIHIPILFTLFGIYSKRIDQESSRFSGFSNIHDRLSGVLAERQNKGFFARLWSGGTSSIKKQLEANQQRMNQSNENLVTMTEALELIKTKLSSSVDIYVDGERI